MRAVLRYVVFYIILLFLYKFKLPVEWVAVWWLNRI